ncbi:flagellin [Halobaculum sp. MBLA0147]|uniref:flagellin n=1 Tax=Halobaculum sp. MBLA0147 TaxID=3079934 RepID=UPI0035246745
MGISHSASAAVIFLGVFVAAGSLYPAVANGTERVTDAQQAARDNALAEKNTEINVTRAVYYTGKRVEVNVTNTGTTTLDLEAVNLLVDGEATNPTGTIDGVERETWLPGETANFSVDFANEKDRVVVVVDYGVSGAKPVRVVT